MVDVAFFIHNRNRLRASLDGNAAVLLTAYDNMQLKSDMAVPFRQESNFWYLSGLSEPGWKLLIAPDDEWLIAPEVSQVQEVFDGSLSPDEASRQSGVGNVIRESELEDLLRQLEGRGVAFYGLGPDPHEAHYDFSVNPAPGRVFALLQQNGAVGDVRPVLAKMRARKTAEEVRLIEEAIDLTTLVFGQVRDSLAKYEHEYEVEAFFTAEFRRRNARHAYDPIVAGGKNACTLHYVANADSLRSGSLLLLDIGAEAGGYAADITRTFAIGEPTERQRAVHAALKESHLAIIDLLKPGLEIKDYLASVDEIMQASLASLGLLSTPDDYRRYFPHAVSHGLGVDVHDSLGGYRELQPGMVLTVEPGIYVPEEGLGIRLEDDILITEDGHRNLSQGLSLDL